MHDFNEYYLWDEEKKHGLSMSSYKTELNIVSMLLWILKKHLRIDLKLFDTLEIQIKLIFQSGKSFQSEEKLSSFPFL